MLVVLAGTRGWAEVGVENKLVERSGGLDESEKVDVGTINTPSGLSPFCCGAGVWIIDRTSAGMIVVGWVMGLAGAAGFGGNTVSGPSRIPKGR